MSFGEDSFHHFLLWQIFFKFAKCFCEKFGNVAQLRFFFGRMGENPPCFQKIKKSGKEISAL